MSQQPNTRLPIGPFSTARPNPTVTLRPRALSSPTHPSQPLPFRTIACRRSPEPPLPSPSAGSASSQRAQPRRLAYPPPTPLPVLLISCQPYSRTTSMFAKPTRTHTHITPTPMTVLARRRHLPFYPGPRTMSEAVQQRPSRAERTTTSCGECRRRKQKVGFFLFFLSSQVYVLSRRQVIPFVSSPFVLTAM